MCENRPSGTHTVVYLSVHLLDFEDVYPPKCDFSLGQEQDPGQEFAAVGTDSNLKAQRHAGLVPALQIPLRETSHRARRPRGKFPLSSQYSGRVGTRILLKSLKI